MGVEIERNREKDEIIIRQSKYVKPVVDRFCLQEEKIALIPMEKGLSLERAEYNGSGDRTSVSWDYRVPHVFGNHNATGPGVLGQLSK